MGDIVKNHLCTICGNTYDNGVFLNYHMLMAHGVKPFECTTCGKDFITKEVMKEHKKHVMPWDSGSMIRRWLET